MKRILLLAATIIILTVIALYYIFSYESPIEVGFKVKNNMTFPTKLSELKVYQGNMKGLMPAEGVYEYKLASSLFTDYAQKQRLVKLPVGTSMKVLDSELPNFPEETIIVKTFFYYDDERKKEEGKNIIESRVL